MSNFIKYKNNFTYQVFENANSERVLICMRKIKKIWPYETFEMIVLHRNDYKNKNLPKILEKLEKMLIYGGNNI